MAIGLELPLGTWSLESMPEDFAGHSLSLREMMVVIQIGAQRRNLGRTQLAALQAASSFT